MESPVANSSTNPDVGGGTSKTMIPPSSNTGGVPSPAPPFFANPFMSPFLQQQSPHQNAQAGNNQIIPPNNLQQQMQQQFQQHFAAAAATAAANSSMNGTGDPTTFMAPQNGGGGSTDFRMNPFTGGFFLPPNQYQEMMQQYLQTLMLQAGNVPLQHQQQQPFSEHQTPSTTPAPGTSTQSPSPPLASNDPAAAAFNGLATLNLGQLNLASPTAPTPPPAMTAAASMQFNPISGGSRQSTPSKVSTASVGIASGGASTNCSSSPSPSFTMMNGISESSNNISLKDSPHRNQHQQHSSPSSMAQESTTKFIETINSMAPMESKDVIIEDSFIKETETVPDTSPEENMASESKESEVIPDTAVAAVVAETEEQPKRKFDARADELFRKQMNEIEQEINRRIQNRNVRKLNEEELSQLLNETGFGNFVEAGKPTSQVSEQMGHLIREPSPPPAVPKNPTLNQLRSSFSPPEIKPSILEANPFPQLHQLQQQPQHQANPLPAYPFSFGSVQMAQPPSDPTTAPFMPSSTAYSVQHDLQPRQSTPVGYIPGLDPPPHLPAPPLDLPPPISMENGSLSSAAAALPNPSTITPEMAAMLLKQIQESNPQLLSSLGLVPASQISEKKTNEVPRIPAPPSAASAIPRRNGTNNSFHSNGTTASTSTTGINENGWSQIDKRHSLNGENNQNAINQQQPTSSSSVATGNLTGQENNNKENSQEPIWVMRDSYLKRLQREEQRNKELQNGTAGSSTSTTSGLLNGVVDEEQDETDNLLHKDHNADIEEQIKTNIKKPAVAAKKEVMVHEPAVLIEGVLFRARYLGSTQLTCDGRPTKSSRMAQAQEAVARVKAPEGEIQPSTEIDLFISTEKIMVLNTDLQRISETDVRQDILMDHALRSISYIADIGDVVVLMARRMPQGSSTSSDEEDLEVRRTPRVVCHVFESEEASFIAQSIGQAFQVAYVEFLRSNGIDDPAYLREIDYQEVLNSQELLGEELDLFSSKETQKDIVIPKKVGEALGVVVVESGWGSMLPTVVVAKMEPNAPSARSNLLNIGDQIIAINGISLVGLPLAKAQQNIKNAKTSTAVRLTIVSTPPVVEVRIKRPDTKYQLGFSVQNGVICSLLRGGIAERGGIRVGHRIIEINHKSVVAIPHEKIVNMLATATGEIQLKTMPTSMFRLLTGQEVPNYI